MPLVYSKDTKQKFMDFISFFGTDYVEQVTLGGKCQEIIYWKNSALSTFVGQSNSATEAVKVHFFIRAGANNANSCNTTSQTSFSQSINNTEAYFYGG